MTKISTLFYLVDNTNTDESIEIAGRILEKEYADILSKLENSFLEPSEALINKTIEMCNNI